MLSTPDTDHQVRLAIGHECHLAALEYLRRGWSALALCNPLHIGVGKKHLANCKSPGKRPIRNWKQYQRELPTETDIRDWWRDNPLSNVGIALGPVSGLVRVDADGPGGEQALQKASGGILPDTLEFTSGRGRGLLFAIPPGVELRTTTEKPKPGEELRLQAEGALTVLPPSAHYSGCRYLWRTGHGPDDIQAALMPPWLVDL